jgi:hypothetical protein
MYYLIMTMVLWQPAPAAAAAVPTIQMIEFRDEGACMKAAAKWKAGVLAARPRPDPPGPQPALALSAECVASDSTSRIK